MVNSVATSSLRSSALPRFLVQGECGWLLQGGRILAWLGMAGAAVSWVLAVPLAGWACAAGLCVCGALESIAFSRRMSRTWIEVDSEGFTVIDRHGKRAIQDHQVVGISYFVRKRFINGTHSGNRRTCRLWLASMPRPVVMDNTFRVNTADPLSGLIHRLLDLLRDGFHAALEHGLPISGDGWELQRDELRYTSRKQKSLQLLPISEIAAVEVHDGQLGVWRRGEDLPCVQFDPNGRNARLLQSLLEMRLRPADKTAMPVDGSLGRVLFQRRMKRSDLMILKAVAVLSLTVGAGLLFARAPVARGALFALPIGVAVALFAFACSKSQFRAHVSGVFKASLWGSRRLLYDDVAAFTYSAMKMYHHGAYTGTVLQLRFDAKPGRGRKVSYRSTVNGDDTDLDHLRDFISRVIAADMLKRLRAGEEVPWTNNLRFTPDGVWYRSSGIFGPSAPGLLPYENYGGWNLNAGRFFLFEKDNAKAVMSESTGARNFFPGLSVLWLALDSETRAEEGASPSL